MNISDKRSLLAHSISISKLRNWKLIVRALSYNNNNNLPIYIARIYMC